MSAELVFALNMSCGDCGVLGPPPSAILTLPPPPMPAFLQRLPLDNNIGVDPCVVDQACDWGGAPGVEYVELPRQVGGPVDDTWFLVLISCCAGVLLLAAALAVVLMRCRQGRGAKCALSLDPGTLDGKSSKSSMLVGGEVLYPDPRALWAALTPSGGTQHFVAPAPVPHLQLTQRHLTPPPPASPPRSPSAEPEYAMPGPLPLSAGPPPLEPPPPPPFRVAAFAPQARHSQNSHTRQHGHVNKMATISHAACSAVDSSHDNSGFVDTDDPVMDSFLLGAANGYYHTVGPSVGPRPSRASGRPKVSSPTRIPYPNLPPLNLHPSATTSRSLRRVSRRNSDAPAV